MPVPPVSTLGIRYESEEFPPASLSNGNGLLAVTWDDILWAAITIGRPNLHYVFRNGDASLYEAVFRFSMVRMALQQRGPSGQRLVRTDALKSLDPTEKGAVNYFLGMVVCKVFAAKLLDTPWLLHLDIFGNQIGANVLRGRSRPDLIGQPSLSSQWHGFECKGRASPPLDKEKTKAKLQAQRLVSVGGTNCTLHVGAITYFRNDVLEFYWRDPPPGEPTPILVPEPEGNAWREYYAPIAEILRFSRPPGTVSDGTSRYFAVAGLDLEVSVHHELEALVLAGNWTESHRVARERIADFVHDGYQPDGLAVRAGQSWRQRFER
jgi:hypothetical protein